MQIVLRIDVLSQFRSEQCWTMIKNSLIGFKIFLKQSI